MLYFPFFRWNMRHLSRKQLIIFFILVLTSKKQYPFIFLHFLLCLPYKITHHLLKAHQLEYASFYHCRKWYPILFVVKNGYSILIGTINKSVKSVLRQRILIYFKGNFFKSGILSYNQDMSSQDIPPKLPGHLFCFLLMLKRQCIRVWLWKIVRCANKWSYWYWILSLDRLKVYFTTPQWNKS